MVEITSQDYIKVFNFRPLSSFELEWFLHIRNEVKQFLHDQRAFDLHQTEIWFNQLPREKEYWIVTHENIDIGYFRLSHNENSNFVWIGLDLAPEQQGKGLARLAYYAFIDEILIPRGVDAIYLRVLNMNTKAIKLYLSMGFTFTSRDDIDSEMVKKL